MPTFIREKKEISFFPKGRRTVRLGEETAKAPSESEVRLEQTRFHFHLLHASQQTFFFEDSNQG